MDPCAQPRAGRGGRPPLLIPVSTVAHLYTNKASGAAGGEVTLSGDGFKPGEQIRITAQAIEVGRTTANEQGAFSGVEVTVPTTFKGFPGGTPIEFDATGEESIQNASAPFTLSG